MLAKTLSKLLFGRTAELHEPKGKIITFSVPTVEGNKEFNFQGDNGIIATLFQKIEDLEKIIKLNK